jgi:leishmanolysin-like peptidase
LLFICWLLIPAVWKICHICLVVSNNRFCTQLYILTQKVFTWNFIQYFSSIPGVPYSETGRFGGSVALADYCPYLQEFVWKQDSDFIRGSRCALVQNTLEPSQNYLLEKYSPRSKCFNHASGWALRQCNNIFTPHSGSGCYEYSCSSETGLTIYVMEREYRCSYPGQMLTIQYTDHQWLYLGNITCPSCVEICQVSLWGLLCSVL